VHSSQSWVLTLKKPAAGMREVMADRKPVVVHKDSRLQLAHQIPPRQINPMKSEGGSQNDALASFLCFSAEVLGNLYPMSSPGKRACMAVMPARSGWRDIRST